MTKNKWLHTVIAVSLVRALVITAFAQETPLPAAKGTSVSASAAHSRFAGRGGNGFQSQLDKAVGLTMEQRDAVRGLMAQQRKERTAIQEQTDAKIRAILNSEQQKKFDAFLAEQKQSRSARFSKAS